MYKTKIWLLLLLILCLFSFSHAKVTIEEDIDCDSRDDSMLIYIQSKSVGKTYNIKTIDTTDDIILCGLFESTKGLVSKVSKNGTFGWGYITQITCEVMIFDSKQQYGLFLLYFPNRGVEIHNYALEDGTKNYIYEYQLDTITSINDGAFYNDYFWFTGSQSTNNCYIMKLSKTRRYVYDCPSNIEMKSLWFPSSNPTLVGYDQNSYPQLLQINPSNFSTTIQMKLENMTSTNMWVRNRWENDAMMVWALTSSTNNTMHLAEININTTSIGWSKKYDLSLSYPVFEYNTVFEDYILIGMNTGLNKHCFVRFDPGSGSIKSVKCTENSSFATYAIHTQSLHIDSGSSIYIGGQLSSENFFYYKTGLELGDDSCLLSGSSFLDSSEYTIEAFDTSLSNTTLAITEQTSGRWINRTDRSISFDTTLTTTWYCYPSIKIPIIRPRYYTQRFMETLPKICPGYDTNEVSVSDSVSLTVKKGSKANSDMDFAMSGKDRFRISSFWMETGKFDVQISITNTTTLAFEAEYIITGYMMGIVSLIYLIFLIVAVQAFISQDYFCLKHMIYSAQFIHLISMLAVNLPPPLVYLIQRFSIFGFIEGIFGKVFFRDSFRKIDIDSYYRANYETTSFLSNQALSVFMIVGVLVLILLRHYIIDSKKTEEEKRLYSGKGSTKDASTGHPIWDASWFEDIKRVSINIFAILFPYLLLHTEIDISNYTFKNLATKLSFFLSCFILMFSLKVAFLLTMLAFHNFKHLVENSNDETIVFDNLFYNLRVRNMIKTHIIFWSKRVIVILTIIVSPYAGISESIICGFIVLLSFTSMELEYRATGNELEFLYVFITALPPLIVSFINMLMEGHYISYNSKYIVSELTIFSVMLVYFLILPLRFYDFYKYQKDQKQKKLDKIQSKQNNHIATTAKDFMTSKYNDEVSVSAYDGYDQDSAIDQFNKNGDKNEDSKNEDNIGFDNKDQEDYKPWKMKKIVQENKTRIGLFDPTDEFKNDSSMSSYLPRSLIDTSGIQEEQKQKSNFDSKDNTGVIPVSGSTPNEPGFIGTGIQNDNSSIKPKNKQFVIPEMK